MKRPTKLRVGPFDIAIGLLPPVLAHDNFGNYQNEDQTINLRETYANPRQEAGVLLHEAFHAIWDIYQVRDDDKEERIVSVFEVGMAQVLRDNPEFGEWLRQALK